jgi:hypothetical protein
MSNVVNMKEGAILDPKVIESIVMNGDLSKLTASTESGVLQLQMQSGRA